MVKDVVVDEVRICSKCGKVIFKGDECEEIHKRNGSRKWICGKCEVKKESKSESREIYTQMSFVEDLEKEFPYYKISKE